MDMHLADKVVVVTGGGAGIGAATARLFAEEGARVVVADRDGEAAATVAGGLPQALAVTVDVRDSASCAAMVEAAVTAFGGLDVLVNNAGRGALGTVETQDEDEWDDILDINLKGVFLCSRHAVPALRTRGGGAIVNTASNVAMAMAIRDRTAYVASKGGVAALTRSMALDLAGDNIRVNAVAPGVIWTGYYDGMLARVPDPEAFKAGLRARAPTNRWGTPEEIASAIVWLASDRASFATGTMLTVDGGASIW